MKWWRAPAQARDKVELMITRTNLYMHERVPWGHDRVSRRLFCGQEHLGFNFRANTNMPIFFVQTSVIKGCLNTVDLHGWPVSPLQCFTTLFFFKKKKNSGNQRRYSKIGLWTPNQTFRSSNRWNLPNNSTSKTTLDVFYVTHGSKRLKMTDCPELL